MFSFYHPVIFYTLFTTVSIYIHIIVRIKFTENWNWFDLVDFMDIWYLSIE